MILPALPHPTRENDAARKATHDHAARHGSFFYLVFFFFGPGRDGKQDGGFPLGTNDGRTVQPARGIHATAGLAWLRMPPTETEFAVLNSVGRKLMVPFGFR